MKEVLLKAPDGMTLRHRSIAGREGAPSVFVAHGQAGHSGYCLPFARLLAAGGWTVSTGDLRAHGQSTNEHQPLGHLDPETGWDQLKSDLRTHLETAFDCVPFADRIVVAPTLSSFLVLDLLKEWPDLARNIVLIGPAPNHPGMIRFARAFAHARSLFRPVTTPDEQILHHLYAHLGAQIPGKRHLADALTGDQELADRIAHDPEGWLVPTTGYWMAVFDGYRRAYSWPDHCLVAPGTRVLVLNGEEDALYQNGQMVEPLRHWLQRTGIRDFTSASVPLGRHAFYLDHGRHFSARAIRAFVAEGRLQAGIPADLSGPEDYDVVAETAPPVSNPETKIGDAVLELASQALSGEESWAEMLYHFAAIYEEDGSDQSDNLERTIADLMPYWNRAFELDRLLMTQAATGVLIDKAIARLGIAGLVVDKAGNVLDRLGTKNDPAGEQETVTIHPAALRQTALARGGAHSVVLGRRPVFADKHTLEHLRGALIACGLDPIAAGLAGGLSLGLSPDEAISAAGARPADYDDALHRALMAFGVSNADDLIMAILISPLGWLAPKAAESLAENTV